MAKSSAQTVPSGPQPLRLPFSTVVNKRIEQGSTFANEPIMTGSGKDRYIVNMIPLQYDDPITGRKEMFLVKRPGFSSTLINSGKSGRTIYSWEGSSAFTVFTKTITIWSDKTVYVDDVSIGATSGNCYLISEGFLNTTPVLYFVAIGDNTGWYYPLDATIISGLGTLTSGSPTVTAIASTTGWYSGQLLSGTGIPAGTRILTVDSATQITMTNNATANGVQTINREGIAKILDADFPGNAGKTLVSKMVYKDGFTFILTEDGYLYNSNLNSITSWTSTSYILSNEYADAGTYLILYKNLIVVFNSFSIEFFENVGNATGSPLQRINHLSTRIGCPQATLNGVTCEAGGNVYWIAADETNSLGLYHFNGYTPEKISTLELDILLAKDTYRALSIVPIYGQLIAIFSSSSTSNDYNLAYNLNLRTIFWISIANVANSHIIQAISSGADAKFNKFLLDSADTSGKYYFHASLGTVWQDDGTNFTCTIQTGRFDGGTNQFKRLNKLTLLGDKQSSTTTVAISWSDDDHGTFTTARNVDMSNVNTYLSHCGSFRRRTFKLTNTSNTPLRLEAMEFEMDSLWH